MPFLAVVSYNGATQRWQITEVKTVEKRWLFFYEEMGQNWLFDWLIRVFLVFFVVGYFVGYACFFRNRLFRSFLKKNKNCQFFKKNNRWLFASVICVGYFAFFF